MCLFPWRSWKSKNFWKGFDVKFCKEIRTNQLSHRVLYTLISVRKLEVTEFLKRSTQGVTEKKKQAIKYMEIVEFCMIVVEVSSIHENSRYFRKDRDSFYFFYFYT